MFPILDVIKLFGSASSGVVGWGWDKVIQGIYNWFASGLLLLMEWVWNVLDDGATPRLTDEWFAGGLVGPLAAISLSIIVALMLASAIQAGLAGRPELILDAIKEGPKAIVATALTVVVMDVAIRGADAITETIWNAGQGDVMSMLDSIVETQSVAGGLAVSFLGPLALLFGMVGMMVTAVVLFMRSALLYLVAGFAPIVWASSVSPIMRGSSRRLVHLTVALVLAKPAIALTLVVGAKLVANNGSPGVDGVGVDGAAALGTLLTGFACFAIAGLSPWVIFKLLPSVESAGVSSGIVGGWGRSAMAGASAVLMVKSLGASKAASAATKAVPQMQKAVASTSAGSTSVSGGSAHRTAGASSATGGAATSRSNRPPIPPSPPKAAPEDQSPATQSSAPAATPRTKERS
ncbi:hypothetical protein [Ilumatobacter nonamiensis]|uniref:hypothetical protein n=1 Tax=Ilumatobacter nonamiensis TaxID=467093 RepID=UPI000685D3A5|nr:hypothetical protein [Ilumatobacter nonamiensis]